MRRASLVLVAILLLLLPTLVVADSHRVGIPYTSYDPLSGDGLARNSWCRLGQVMFIPNRCVASIGYNVWRIGEPAGDVILSIYNSAGGLMFSKVWGDASNLTAWGAGPSPIGVTLDEPMCINATVRICVEYYGGDGENYCAAGYYTGDRITGECYTNYRYGQWHDIGEAEEGAYFYTWVDEISPESTEANFTIPLWAIIPVGLIMGGAALYVNTRQRKKT